MWGRGSFGRLGTGHEKDHYSPVEVFLPGAGACPTCPGSSPTRLGQCLSEEGHGKGPPAAHQVVSRAWRMPTCCCVTQGCSCLFKYAPRPVDNPSWVPHSAPCRQWVAADLAGAPCASLDLCKPSAAPESCGGFDRTLHGLTGDMHGVRRRAGPLARHLRRERRAALHGPRAARQHRLRPRAARAAQRGGLARPAAARSGCCHAPPNARAMKGSSRSDGRRRHASATRAVEGFLEVPKACGSQGYIDSRHVCNPGLQPGLVRGSCLIGAFVTAGPGHALLMPKA